MAAIEESDKYQLKCEWCGKSGISDMWSGKKALYCSFKCNAAGSYRMFVLISITSSMLTAMVVMIMVMMQMQSSSSEPIPLMFILPIVLLIGIDLSFIYSAFIGRLMRKARDASL